MKKLRSYTMATMLILLLLTGCSTNQTTGQTNNETSNATSNATSNETSSTEGTIQVYTSFYPMYDFTKKIGGDRIQLTNLVPSGIEPHDWEPTPSDIGKIDSGDVFIYNGAGMEHWVNDILDSLQNDHLLVAETSKGISLMESTHHEEGHEEEAEEHGAEDFFDPHVWLSPVNAKHQMKVIAEVLSQADPANKDYFEENLKKYTEELDQLDKEYQEKLANVSSKDIVVAHEAYGYLCQAYNLNQIGIQGLSPDSEPDPARMSEIIKFAKDHQIKVIFFEELVSPKVAETIAKEVGAETRVLSPIEGISQEEQDQGADYFSKMRDNLTALQEALN